GAIEGSVHIQADSITKTASFFLKESVRASVKADAVIGGNLRKPDISAIVQIGPWSYGKFQADTIFANCRYNGQSLQWQSLFVKRGAASLTCDGALSRAGRTGPLNAECKFSLDYANPNDPLISATGDLALADTIATARIIAGLKGIEMPLTITAHIPVALSQRSRGGAALRDGAVVTINGDSIPSGILIHAFVPSVTAQGTISLNGSLIKTKGAWNLACSTHIVNNRLTLNRDKIKAGRALLDLRITGALLHPAARFTLSGDSLEYRGNLISAYSGRGSIQNNMAWLDTLQVFSGGGEAGLSARAPLNWKNGFTFNNNGRISATIGAMPLSVMQPILPEAVTITKGVISGRVEATGNETGLPQVTGTLALRNGEGYIYECDKPLGPISADLDFRNDSMILRNLRADLGGGRVAGSGWAALNAKGITGAHGVISLDDAHLAGCYENLDLGIQRARIDFARDSLTTITLNAVLAETRFTQDFSLIDLAQQIKKKAPQRPRPPNPLWSKVVLHLAVDLNGKLSFDSNLGRMLVDGTVSVSGRADKPEISGQFALLNGFVYYLDRKFTITQGAIRQYDPLLLNPSLDITATAPVSWYPPQGGKEDYDITLRITGDLANPVVALSAVPSLPQPQIISLLTFGTIQTGLGATDLSSRSGSLLSQQLAGFGTRRLARILNVESVDLYGNVFGPASAGPQLSVTKQVSSRVSLTYQTALSSLGQQMVLVSYRLLSFLYLEAQTDQQAQGGIDLKFRVSR
ncbi:MAG: translocation/assembly module TamB domain-containing protein, partial [Chitinivibrionales bacterium]|nr:translocation/assembly module TamB domain-containing protein [Chitinivibrionales bacterium]